MQLFKNSRTMKVIMRDFHGGQQAVKETELGRKTIITMDLDVPITKPIKEGLPEYIQNFLNSNGGHQDAPGKRLEILFSFKSSVRFARLDDKKVLAECGFGDSGEPCMVTVTKFFFIGAVETMRVRIVTDWREDLWAMGGTYLGDGELLVTTKPFQGEIAFDEETQKKQDAKDEADLDPGEKIARKKAKKTLPEEKPEPATV